MTTDTDHDTDFYFSNVEYKATSLIFYKFNLVYEEVFQGI